MSSTVSKSTAGMTQQYPQLGLNQPPMTATERFYGQHPSRRRRADTTTSVASASFPTPASTIGGSPRKRKGTNPESAPAKEPVQNVNSLEKLRLTTQAFTRMRETTDSTNSPTSTATSRGGSGQQFTVASVGNNGMLYLRPVTRRMPQQMTGFPSTPPKTAEKNSLEITEESDEEIRPITPPLKSNISIPKTPPHSPRRRAPNQLAPSSPPIAKNQNLYQRARSYSTTGNRNIDAVPKFDAANVRITIEKAETVQRPKTAGVEEENSIESHLDIKIPGHNFHPSFTPSGTPFIFGTGSTLPPMSVGAEDGHNSYMDIVPDSNRESQWVWPLVESPTRNNDRTRPSMLSSRLTSEVSSLIVAAAPIITGGYQQITPNIYDRLSFAPYCDDPTIVKYHAKTREITAATPPRIIAAITSATFLDYQLLSDFFLTFRAFMPPSDLVAHLLARLRWAIEREDDIGKVVRVRTFVAMRHWLLNYFADDFLPSIELREQFANGLNDLTDDIKARARPDHSDMKIIGELKKCWRKSCALYWNPVSGLHPGQDTSVEKNILPGGSLGSREDPKALAEAFHDEQLFRARKGKSKEASRLSKQKPISSLASGATERLIRDVINAGRDGANPTVGNRISTADIPLNKKRHSGKRTKKPRRNSGRPTSQIKSTSLPSFSPRATIHEDGMAPPLPTQKIPSFPSTPTNHNFKTILNYSASKSSPRDAHKRNASFSDSLRNKAHPPESFQQSGAKMTQLPLSFILSGSLVRGNLIPPTPATVELIAPSTPAARSLLDIPSTKGSQKVYNHRIAVLTGPGVKKMFGNMKRALSSKTPNLQVACATDDISSSPPEALARYVREKGRDTTLTGILSRTGSFSSNIGDLTRIDLLGAGVVEAFHKALEDDPRGRSYPENQARGRPESSGSTTSQDTMRQSIVTPRASRLESAFIPPTDNGESGDSDDEYTKKTSLTPTPLRRPGPKRVHSAGLAIESGSLKIRKQGSFGRVALDTWAASGVVTPSPSASVSSTGRSHSFSYEATPDVYKRSFGESLHQRLSEGILGMQLRLGEGLASPGSGSDDKSYLSFNSTNLLPRSEVSSGAPIEESFEEDDMRPLSSSPMTKSLNDPFARPPARMLRRRPGGDLKAINNIAEMIPEARPQSAGTLGTFDTYTDSTLSMNWPKRNQSVLYSQPNLQHNGVLSLGAITQKDHILARGASLLHRQSILNRMPTRSRKSVPETFEAGVLKLAELPDTASDDGGVDVALAKLEGTYHRRSLTEPTNDWRSSMSSRELYEPSARRSANIAVHVEEVNLSSDEEAEDDNHEGEDKKRRRQLQVVDPSHLESFNNSTGGSEHGLHPMSAIAGLDLRAINESRDFVPILNRGLSNVMSDTTISLQDIEQNMMGLMLAPSPPLDGARFDSEARDPTSFYHSRDSLASTSSDESLDAIKRSYKRASVSSSALPAISSNSMSHASIPSHPLHHPPSPPLTNTPALSESSPESAKYLSVDNRPIPTAVQGRNRSFKGPKRFKSNKKVKKPAAAVESVEAPMTIHVTSIHLPFILAYDSELLAKQFTIIEKDALSEIDWKELVELRWKQTTTPVRDWVEFLAAGDIRGVEVVIARFNLVCKWVMSEIVMTRNIQERARCIVKYIHIAAHARRLQNFATMYQIAVALLASDIARLRKTWALISVADIRTFRELESLVQPVRNFHNLRMEMETVTGETGCIPFVGLYTHDLIYNAQRPSQIASTPSTAPLVNFERHRMTAMIIKRLLRLVEASQKYEFKPVDGVCERCLWIATLKDDELRQLSYELETG